MKLTNLPPQEKANEVEKLPTYWKTMTVPQIAAMWECSPSMVWYWHDKLAALGTEFPIKSKGIALTKLIKKHG